MLASGENRDLARSENRGNSHRDRFARYVRLAKEISGRVATRDVVEVDRARHTGFARAGFIEADVSSLADAEQLKVDAAGSDDCGFVGAARVIDFGARRRAAE